MSNVIKFQAPFEKIKFTQNNPDAMLRIAIILQAVIDATSISDSPKDIEIRDEAQDWIFKKNPAFVRMCEEAGIEADYIVRTTQKAIFFHRNKKFKQKTDEILDTIKEHFFFQSFDTKSVFL